MEFEFDPNKSQINKGKHGIDFEEAKALWLDPHDLTVPAKNVSDRRLARIAQMNGKLWCAIFTYREGKVRLISVRRAHPNEERQYENS